MCRGLSGADSPKKLALADRLFLVGLCSRFALDPSILFAVRIWNCKFSKASRDRPLPMSMTFAP